MKAAKAISAAPSAIHRAPQWTNPIARQNSSPIRYDEFRSNGGKLSGQFAARLGEKLLAGAPMIIVTHKGAKSGTTYTSPLVYSKDGDKYVIIASKGGAPENPSWYHNLVAHPEVTVEIGSEKFKAKAREVKGEERDRLFNAQAKIMPQFNEYQKKTSRKIPVIVLERVK
jgi:deazaflavin-dependent oxidoreductase (nitroreductase family)